MVAGRRLIKSPLPFYNVRKRIAPQICGARRRQEAFPPCFVLGLRDWCRFACSFHERLSGVGWLGAEFDPVVNSLNIDNKGNGLTTSTWVVVAEHFNKASVATDALFSNNQSIGWLVFCAEALEADA